MIGLRRSHVHSEPSIAPPERHGVSENSGDDSKPEVYSCGEKMSMSELLRHEVMRSDFAFSEDAYGALWLVVTMTSRPWAWHMAKTFSISRTSWTRVRARVTSLTLGLG